jgi:hypothetical protein
MDSKASALSSSDGHFSGNLKVGILLSLPRRVTLPAKLDWILALWEEGRTPPKEAGTTLPTRRRFSLQPELGCNVKTFSHFITSSTIVLFNIDLVYDDNSSEMTCGNGTFV